MYLILSLPLSLLALLVVQQKNKLFWVPYLFFLIGPMLTYFGVIRVLTGFNGSGLVGGATFGITFYTVYIAYQISKNRESIRKYPKKFIVSTINPLYLFSGPIPIEFPINATKFSLKRLLKILNIVNSDFVLGLFFSNILAPSLTPYFYLKGSENIIDIFLFGLIFELYVYFNFSGYSMVAWSLMRLIGIKAPRNFRQPFGANSIVDYWQRWHTSLSRILKELFFIKVKPILGLYGAVFLVFIFSAMWHGITINFFLWGLFHSILWCLAYFLNKLNLKVINYILLIFGIIVGRVIFSEIDWMKLSLKLSIIFDFAKWSVNSDFIFLTQGVLGRINLFFIFLIIGWEVAAPAIGFPGRDYKHLKSAYASTLITIYVCLAFVGFDGVPIYGDR